LLDFNLAQDVVSCQLTRKWNQWIIVLDRF
jgi:hypothetical protein